MKTRFTGRKQNKRKRILLSSRRSPKEGVNGGENGLSEAITRCRPRPLTLLLFPVMPHVLYVVVIVENIEHFAELFSLLLVELNVVGRYLFLFG